MTVLLILSVCLNLYLLATLTVVIRNAVTATKAERLIAASLKTFFIKADLLYLERIFGADAVKRSVEDLLVQMLERELGGGTQNDR